MTCFTNHARWHAGRGPAVEERAVWSSAYVNSLPDSAFLWIDPKGGRHLPYKDKTGKVDKKHLDNAAARLNQVKGMPQATKKRIAARIKSLQAKMKVSRAAGGADLYMTEPYFRDGGAHKHEVMIENDAQMICRGGCHRHVFVTNAGLVVMTDMDGTHSHSGSDGAHDHIVAVEKDGAVELYRTSAAGAHSHEMLYSGTSYGGVHTHALKIDGEKITSLNPRGMYSNAALSYEALIRARSAGAKARPAIEVRVEASPEIGKIRVLKRAEDLDKGLVYAVVLSPHYFDTFETWFDPTTIERAAHDWLERSRLVDVQHEEISESRTVESFIEAYPSKEDYEKAHRNEPHKIFERPFGDDVIRSGEWVVGIQLSAADKEAVVRGDLGGLSIHGVAKSTALGEGEGPPAVEVIKLEGAVPPGNT